MATNRVPCTRIVADMPAKRKNEDSGPVTVKKQVTGELVNPKRVRMLKKAAPGRGSVVYWMSRDQRLSDNWALLYAVQEAQKSNSPVFVAFNLVPEFLGAGARHFCFMLKGMRELENKLQRKGIQFILLKGEPASTIPQLVRNTASTLLVTDYSPLRLGRVWRDQVAAAIDIPFHEVDAHNVVPVWVASDKREVGARTIRPKIHKHLPEFLTEYPEVPTVPSGGDALFKGQPIDWDALIEEVSRRGAQVPEVNWCTPGEDAAHLALTGPEGFLSPQRIGLYEKRNDPSIGKALSHLSPYLHYGQLAAQRAALEAAKFRLKHKGAMESFLEELVVRRELADNFCHYEPNYDNLSAAAAWAQETLRVHAADKREFVYTLEELEAGRTHDELWNASQMEMVKYGKMHGFMRMYWAKKILEWTSSPQEALRIAIYLNDRYELDGRDPNGYVGCMWSIAGIHDQGWGERPIFGKIRYMNYNGCKRKFDVEAYIRHVRDKVKQEAVGRPKPAAAEVKEANADVQKKAAARPKALGEAPKAAAEGLKAMAEGPKALAEGLKTIATGPKAKAPAAKK